MRKILFMLMFFIAFSWITAPSAKAMDPVTIAILAPYAMPYAEKAGHLALIGLMNGADAMVDIFGDMLNIFKLPLGVLETTVGMPFGFFGDGLIHLYEGGIAPFTLVMSTLFLPLRIAGLYK